MSTASKVAEPANKPAGTGLALLPTSTIGSKFIVAITGAGLTLFVIGHMIGNLQVFLGREVFNNYAQFMQSNVELLWVARTGLLVFLIVHIVLALRLKFTSTAARPIPYASKRHHQESDVSSRAMVLTGLVLLAFIIFHLLHFTVGVIDHESYDRHETLNPQTMQWVKGDVPSELPHRHDAYEMMVLGFRQPLIAVTYIIAQIFLGMHLWHGVPSLFQSLGINRPKWGKCIEWGGIGVALLVVIGNIGITTAILVDHLANLGMFEV